MFRPILTAVARYWLVAAAALAVGWAAPTLAEAAEFPTAIVAVQIGLPAVDDGPPVVKFGKWAPLRAVIEVREAVAEPAELVITAPDSDGIRVVQRWPLTLADAAPGANIATDARGVFGYVQLAGDGEITVQLRRRGDGSALSAPYRLRPPPVREPLLYTILCLGQPVPPIELPRPAGGGRESGPTLRGGRIVLTTWSDAAHLPTHWIGYDAADLVVLPAGPEAATFLQQLWSAEPTMRLRQQALREWLGRGGRLLVAAGSQADRLPQWPGLHELLPVDVRGRRDIDLLPLQWSQREAKQFGAFQGVLGLRGGQFPIAVGPLRPSRAARSLIPSPERSVGNEPIAVAQAPYGLGCVTLVTFDLHTSPLIDFPLRAEFWEWLLREAGGDRAIPAADARPRPADAELTQDEDDAAVALRIHLDTFEGIPVISFGWVAVLIVLYLLLIGPVEYLVLKRVFGRLEWTWLSFPVIIVTVTALAVAAAARWKGEELRVNKLDIVDVDVASGQVYGTTWVTLFSPRIEEYVLAVTPHPAWAAEASTENGIGWLGPPRGPRAGLLRRQYHYAATADPPATPLGVLEQVPVQVWSSKSFVAHWSGRLPEPSPVEAELYHPPAERAGVVGSLRHRLPVSVLEDCVVFYGGQAYPLPGGTLHAGCRQRIVLDRGTRADMWLQRESRLEELLRRSPAYAERAGPVRTVPGAAVAPAGPLPLLGVLFHDAALSVAEGVVPRNASLRRLDQSWRLSPGHRGQLLLVGRIAPPPGDAENVLAGGDSPTLLWWRESPQSGRPRTLLSGVGRQETWVRFILPVLDGPSLAQGPP